MNKTFVYQVGNNKKVILWCTANEISRLSGSLFTVEYRKLLGRGVCIINGYCAQHVWRRDLYLTVPPMQM
jgi:hypothetical protein